MPVPCRSSSLPPDRSATSGGSGDEIEGPSELHPLLLEPRYWRRRLAEQRDARPFLFRVPRPDLSGPSCEVEEIRFRAHDGTRLWGLVGYCPILRDRQPARFSTVGACVRPLIDMASVEEGRIEIVLQLPAGRRLEDKVLDVLRACDVASGFELVDEVRVELAGSGMRMGSDELRIAEHLRRSGLVE